jgi:thiamine biosynthesis protein ThiS
MMGEPASIRVTANGSLFQVPDQHPLEAFLAELGFAPELVVVEWNLQAVSPSERTGVRLRDGDRLEIVRIVAGG